jgi:hypothetical protein
LGSTDENQVKETSSLTFENKEENESDEEYKEDSIYYPKESKEIEKHAKQIQEGEVNTEREMKVYL